MPGGVKELKYVISLGNNVFLEKKGWKTFSFYAGFFDFVWFCVFGYIFFSNKFKINELPTSSVQKFALILAI